MAERRTPWVLALALALPTSASAQGIGLEQLQHMMSWQTTGLVLVDELEVAAGHEGTPLELDALVWYGGPVNRVWFRVRGEQALVDGDDGDVEAHAYAGRLVTPWWDLLAGARVDHQWGDGPETRGQVALGLIGLAPLRFEVAPTVFVSHQGDVSARLEAEVDLMLTQRLVLAPEVELNAAVQEVPEWGVGAGLNDLELAARLRYQVEREVAPYLGVSWVGRFGETADLARAAGDGTSEVALVAGARLWR